MSSGFVDAKTFQKEEPSHIEDLKEIHIGVFFDGTNNNMQTSMAKSYRKTGKITPEKTAAKSDFDADAGYSNIAALDSMFRAGHRDNKLFLKVYQRGAGANKSRFVHNAVTSLKGLGFGVKNDGVIDLVSETIKYINDILAFYKDKSEQLEIHFYIYGFSRGATCARLFSHMLTRDTAPLPNHREDEFGTYLKPPLYRNNQVTFLKEFTKKSVDFLGIFDTVASIGFYADEQGNKNPLYYNFVMEKEFRGNYHKNNVTEYGLYISSKVKSAFHICAMDEYRMNFALTDVGKTVPNNCLEIFIPGCHSDIGGGYYDSQYAEKAETVHLDTENTLICLENPQNQGCWKPLNEESWKELGWNNIAWHNADKKEIVSARKNIKGGYANVSLNLMKERTIGKIKENDIFAEPYDRFKVPDKLCKYYEEIKKQVLGKDAVRSWLYPGGSYNSKQYQALRLKYLHFTSTDSVGASLVNCPNRKDGKICRIIYHGDEGDNNICYMYDYKAESVTINLN